MYQLTSEVWLDQQNECYKKVIVITPPPQDPALIAITKLFNRVKFGADSVLYFPFIYGGTKVLGKGLKAGTGAVGKAAQFGKDLALSSSKIDQNINTVMSAARPTSNKATPMFLAKNREAAGKAADANFAIKI